MYGFGIARIANPTAGDDPAFGTGRYAVPGLVRTGGAANTDGLRDDSMVFVDPNSGQVVVIPPPDVPVTPDQPVYVQPLAGSAILPAVTPPVLVSAPAASGFSISDVPWWGWALGAGALFMMKGGR